MFEFSRLLYEPPSCMLEAYRSLSKPCCAVEDAHQASSTDEISPDVTNSPNVKSRKSKVKKQELQSRDDHIEYHAEQHEARTNEPSETVSTENATTKHSKVRTYNNNDSASSKFIDHNSSSDNHIKEKSFHISDSSSVGRRRARAKTIRSIILSQKEMRACNNVVVECVGVAGLTTGLLPLRMRRTDLWKDIEKTKSKATVIVAIEATHISPLDVCIRHGMFAKGVKSPFILGTNFVGIVHHGALPEGIRVAALTKLGSNARYIASCVDALVQVPKRCDASEIVCVISSYLPAFQALHYGRQAEHKRANNSLKGKKVLLTDGASMVEVRAMVQLAFAAQATDVFVIAEDRHHAYIRTHLRAKPLKLDANDWLLHVKNKMDVVIDYNYNLHRNSIPTALAPGGRLVCFMHPPTKFGGLLSDLQNVLDQAAISAIEGGSIYNVYDNWEFAREESKGDLRYLFTLLSSRKIRPTIDRYIPLHGIQQAHDDLQTHGVVGSIICEPWKENCSQFCF